MKTSGHLNICTYRREALMGGLLFLILFGISLFLINTTRSFWWDEIDHRTREIAEIQASTLERAVNRSLSAATILGTHVQTKNGDISDFKAFAKMLYRSLGGITNVQLAPDGIVRHIYPLKGHEKAIGHNLLKDDKRRKEAHLAIKTGTMTLAGPFELVQGGVAVIGRQPVLIKASERAQDHFTPGLPLPDHYGQVFWGFASVLIYMDDLLKMSDLPNLAAKGFNYHLWRYHPDTGKPDSFSGQPLSHPQRVWTQEIRLPNSIWFLEITHIGTMISGYWLVLFVVLSFSISGLASYWLYALLTRPKVLQSRVDRQTSEILSINQQLQQEKLELKKFSNAVAQSGNAIIITDRNGIIEYVNPRFSKVTGYTPEEAIGSTPSIIKSPTTLNVEHEELWEQILSGKSWHGERRNRHKDGRLYWSLVTISPITNEQGEITHFVGVSDDITDSKEAQLQIEDLAYHDPLTGLANRRYFLDRLALAIKQTKRDNNQSALFYLDIDMFKQVNDTLGHEAGDELLKITTERLESCLRETDLAARVGGDEFCILLSNIQEEQSARTVAEKIVDLFRQPASIADTQITVTMSIGITLFDSDRYSANQLIRQADTVLYRIKESGRDNFQFYRD